MLRKLRPYLWVSGKVGAKCPISKHRCPNQIDQPPLNTSSTFLQLTPLLQRSPDFSTKFSTNSLSYCSSLDPYCKSWIVFLDLFNSVLCRPFFFDRLHFYNCNFKNVISIIKYHLEQPKTSQQKEKQNNSCYWWYCHWNSPKNIYLPFKFKISFFCLDSSTLVAFVHLENTCFLLQIQLIFTPQIPPSSYSSFQHSLFVFVLLCNWNCPLTNAINHNDLPTLYLTTTKI